MTIELFHNIFYTIFARFQISLHRHTIIMNTCIFVSFGRDVCAFLCIADVCSYVDWRKMSGEFKCLDQGHYLTLLILNYGKKRTVSVVFELSDENLQ